jgi:hypothetical protein
MSKHSELGGFARPIDTFECDETATLHRGIPIFADSNTRRSPLFYKFAETRAGFDDLMMPR